MTKLASLGCVLFLAACSAGTPEDDVGTNAEQALDTGVYNLGTLASPGKCLDVNNNGSANGTNIHSWTCNGSAAQSFRIENLGGEQYRLVHTGSGKCVDVARSGTADGTNVQLWDCNGTNAQKFWMEWGGENIKLINVAARKCLDVAGAGTANGTNVHIWTCNGTNAQWWRPANIGGGGQPPPPPPPPPTGGGSTGWSNLGARGDGKWVRVKNGCGFPIWVSAIGATATLGGDRQLNPGQSFDALAPNEWPAARVTAYGGPNRQNELEKAEFTFTGGVLNFNVTYVDWVGLPLEIVGVGGNCNGSHVTGCYAQQSQLANSCAEGFLRSGGKCLAARTFCMNPANRGHEYCNRLGPQTPDIYACSGPWANDPRGCAALNRGMTSQPDNPNPALYYQNWPYNTYAKWVHQVCPDIYAFPYDDWQSHGGFRACSGSEVRITFCPRG